MAGTKPVCAQACSRIGRVSVSVVLQIEQVFSTAPGAEQVASVRLVSSQEWEPPRVGIETVWTCPQREQVLVAEPGTVQVAGVRPVSSQAWLRGSRVSTLVSPHREQVFSEEPVLTQVGSKRPVSSQLCALGATGISSVFVSWQREHSLWMEPGAEQVAGLRVVSCQSWPKAGSGVVFLSWHREQVSSKDPATVQAASVRLVSAQEWEPPRAGRDVTLLS